MKLQKNGTSNQMDMSQMSWTWESKPKQMRLESTEITSGAWILETLWELAELSTNWFISKAESRRKNGFFKANEASWCRSTQPLLNLAFETWNPI